MNLVSPRSQAILDKHGLAIDGRRLVKARPKLIVSELQEQAHSQSLLRQRNLGSRNYSFESEWTLSDGAAAYTAAGWGQVGGAQAIIDLGGNQGITITQPSIGDVSSLTPQQVRTDGVVVLYVAAATITGSDVYKIILVGSNNAAVNSSNAILAMLELGKGSAMDAPNCADTTAPLGSGNYPAGEIYEMLFTNEQYGTKYEFASLYNAGTFGSITYSAFTAVLPRQ